MTFCHKCNDGRAWAGSLRNSHWATLMLSQNEIKHSLSICSSTTVKTSSSSSNNHKFEETGVLQWKVGESIKGRSWENTCMLCRTMFPWRVGGWRSGSCEETSLGHELERIWTLFNCECVNPWFESFRRERGETASGLFVLCPSY